MPATVVVGTQFGDEGKGKIIDYYSEGADMIVRYNGGSNAGHTVVIGDEQYKLHLMPSGVFREGKICVIGNGVVVDPEILLTELSVIQAKLGREPALRISDRAHVIMPYHKMIDEVEEKLKGSLSAGTTKRGIGPCYSDKSGRFGIRVGDLLDRKALSEKIGIVLPMKEKFMHSHGVDIKFNEDEIVQQYTDYGAKLRAMISDTSVIINKALDEGKNVLLEGAQGTLLDIDHGIYPFGTSSNPISGGACTGAGIGPTKINAVIGVVKAYTSRVGEGPFPTELKNSICDHLREKGGEYGTSTGRPRLCGWLDMVMLKYAVRLNSLTSLAITKLDVLGGIKEIKVAKQYCFEGSIIRDFPSNIKLLAECTPIYDQFDGWDFYTDEQWKEFMKKGYNKFPENLVKYVEFIEKECGVPVEIVSFGRERELTIRLHEKINHGRHSHAGAVPEKPAAVASAAH